MFMDDALSPAGAGAGLGRQMSWLEATGGDCTMIEPAPLKASKGAVSVSILLAAIAALLWMLSLATLAELGRSDAAGNALGEAYAAIEIIALWSLLTLMTVIAGIKGRQP